MTRIAASDLEALARDLMQAAGALESEAAVIARHLIGANLAGHDSTVSSTLRCTSIT